MKTTIIFSALFFSTMVGAEICTVGIRDQNGNIYNTFIRTSYSMNAACDNALWDCQQMLSEYRSLGNHYNSYCEVLATTPTIPPFPPVYPIPPFPPMVPNFPNYPNYPNYPAPHWPFFPHHPPHWPIPGRWPHRH